MNQNWKKFLLAENISFENHAPFGFSSAGQKTDGQLFPVIDLGILTVAGNDAGRFLQGQTTCDVNAVSDEKASLGAFCNPKGRVISTFILAKSKDDFLLLLPVELLEAVKKRLSLYVLRSDVKLTDSTDDLCLIGVYDGDHTLAKFPNSERWSSTSLINEDSRQIQLSENHYLTIAKSDDAISYWSEKIHSNFAPEQPSLWRYVNILSGIPWLSAATSEEYIPQMLNLDKLGGISFNKGCYTGQEIVARTHYLGKAKREMVLAECNTAIPPAPNTIIYDYGSGQEEVFGKVLQAQCLQSVCKLLIVKQISEKESYQLKLDDQERNTINLLTL